MRTRGVVVACHHRKEDPIALSGIAFDDGRVLTSGHALLQLAVAEREHLRRALDSIGPWPAAPRDLNRRLMFAVLREPCGGAGREHGIAGPGREATIAAVWRCPLVSRTIESVDFGRKGAAEEEEELALRLHGLFVVLVEKERRSHGDWRFWGTDVARARRGRKVLVESTPFGLPVFFNCLSKGIVSGLLGEQDCLFVTDANTVRGATGAPIYATSGGAEERGRLLGMVLLQISAGEGDVPSGLTLAVSLSPVLRRLASPCRKFRVDDGDGDVCNATVRRAADQTVVVVTGERTRGTGVVVHGASGLVLTCAHVAEAPEEGFTIRHDGRELAAELVYRTENDAAYDLAVLKTSPFAAQVEFASAPPVPGETVLSAGYPAEFDWSDRRTRPMIVEGCVAKASPFMVQTTCRVYPGCSGSPLFRSDGKFLGIFVCNVNEDNRGPHPDMSFVVPAHGVIAGPIGKYVESGHVSHLEEGFTCDDPHVQRSWRLQSSKL